MTKTIATVLLAAALAAGCATRGTHFEMSDVDSLQPGKTTLQEAVQKLGKPRAVNTAQDGSKSVLWVYARAGIAGSESRGTRIIFDKDGKMVRVASKVE